MNGGPGAIRTPDPQIRSLSHSFESKGYSFKPDRKPSVSDQGLTKSVQTVLGSPKENPGAVAAASGATSLNQWSVSQGYAHRAKAATALATAIADCHPQDACEIMAAALADLSIHFPVPPLFSVMDQASFWARMATQNEAKAYALACYRQLTPRNRAGFLGYVQGGAQ